MIVSKDTNPERDLYYLGARVIEILNYSDTNEFDYVDLYCILKSNLQTTSNLYALTLDWLFIIGAIELSNEGNIKKCF